jgi:Asp-tRNA(Asn)/Glu-tRNA(Gln) amidotransferase A subunit family amidase
MHADLHAARERIRQGQSSPKDEFERCRAIALSPACDRAFLKVADDFPREAAEAAAKPLAGLAVSIKDLFDIEGEATTAASAVLADAPAAKADCPAVTRLKAAGGAVIGRTNMSEFAFSGVGVNPHHGTPVNPCDPAVPRIPGGSSSGAAVSVATGAAWIGLGSDTGGSIRIPAALCGIVGFKNTARLVPAEGALPLSTTLDTVCAMTRSVRDAILAHEILSSTVLKRADAPVSAYRIAIAGTQMQDGLDATVARAFERAVRRLRDAGAAIEEIPLDSIRDLGTIQATGGFSAAESYAWHRQLLAERADRYDPRVRHRIEKGAAMKAYEYVDLLQARRAWIAQVEQALQGFDAVLSPTVPVVAPPIADVAPGAERDEAFFRTNSQLLRNTSIVNMLDGCALSLPCHEPGELPVGIMLWHGALHDDTILNLGLAVERALAAR